MKEILLKFEVSLKVPEDGVKINNLLYQLRKFMKVLYFGILREVFNALEDRAVRELKEKYHGRYNRNGKRQKPRQIKTSYGILNYKFALVFDKAENKTITPLPGIIGLAPYERNTREAAEGGSGLVCHLSYRKSSTEVERIMGTQISKSELHREIQELGKHIGDWPDLKEVPYRFLMVDGTGVRIQGSKKKVEMRWALASRGEKSKFKPVGVWINESWKNIRKDLQCRLNYPGIEVLFSDGGPGIEDNLMAEGMRHQRCIWHGNRDFAYLLYMDGLKKVGQGKFKEKLGSIPAMGMTKAKLEKLKPEDIPKVKEMVQKSTEGFKELLEMLDENKYPKARKYIENLSNNVTAFFDIWLSDESCIPLNTNAIENAFSQVKNRIWTVGKRWSEQGLMNWLKVMMKKTFFPETWDKLWEEYLGLDSSLKFELKEVKYQWG